MLLIENFWESFELPLEIAKQPDLQRKLAFLRETVATAEEQEQQQQQQSGLRAKEAALESALAEAALSASAGGVASSGEL